MPWESSAEGDGLELAESGLKLEVPLETKCRPGIPAGAENQSSQLWWARASGRRDSIDATQRRAGTPSTGDVRQVSRTLHPLAWGC